MIAKRDIASGTAWAIGVCALGVACAGPRTALVVAIASDLTIPGEIAQVHVSVGGAACGGASRCSASFPLAQPADLPLSFGLEPGPSASAPVQIAVEARDAAGTLVVSRTVSTGFVAGQTRVLVVRLDRACAGHDTCASGETCVAGTCTSDAVDPASLALAVPGHELDGLRDAGLDDAGPGDSGPEDTGPRDAGPTDTGPVDVGPGDAGVDAGADGGPDAGTLPTSCRGLLASAPTGLARIDPDGAGGNAPFDAWCENVLDGGGWTLLAKVTGASTMLGYAGAAWTAGPSAAFGTVDQAPSDALLATYWAVPITQLRVGDGTTWIVSTVTGPATTLRGAMNVAGGLATTATLADWEALTTVAPGMVACSHSGIAQILTTSATTVRVRVGIVGGAMPDCSDATFWMGVGASTTTTDAMCTAFTDTSGGARVCGSTGLRRATPATLFVYGR